LDAVGEVDGFEIEWVEYPFGADYYLQTGETLGEDSLKELKQYKSIYLGAVGDPRVPPGVLELGILLKLRFYMDEYINLRPVKLFPGIETPLRNKSEKDICFDVVRENTEDFYIGVGSRVLKTPHKEQHKIIRELYSLRFDLDLEGDADEIAYQIGLISRRGAERVIRYAFELAERKKKRKVSSVDKANVLTYVYGLWRDAVQSVSRSYPHIETEYLFVDAAAMWFVKNPEWFQVVVTPNLFGDILTDLGAMIQGGMGVAPGANINPSGTSTFEPIHGSAPKYRGQNKVNPIATILAGALMLETLGLYTSADKVERAVGEVLKEGKVRTYDLGGSSTTEEVGNAVAERVKRI
jgi:3-isopropylmalate dehydrogenase